MTDRYPKGVGLETAARLAQEWYSNLPSYQNMEVYRLKLQKRTLKAEEWEISMRPVTSSQINHDEVYQRTLTFSWDDAKRSWVVLPPELWTDNAGAAAGSKQNKRKRVADDDAAHPQNMKREQSSTEEQLKLKRGKANRLTLLSDDDEQELHRIGRASSHTARLILLKTFDKPQSQPCWCQINSTSIKILFVATAHCASHHEEIKRKFTACLTYKLCRCWRCTSMYREFLKQQCDDVVLDQFYKELDVERLTSGLASANTEHQTTLYFEVRELLTWPELLMHARIRDCFIRLLCSKPEVLRVALTGLGSLEPIPVGVMLLLFHANGVVRITAEDILCRFLKDNGQPKNLDELALFVSHCAHRDLEKSSIWASCFETVSPTTSVVQFWKAVFQFYDVWDLQSQTFLQNGCNINLSKNLSQQLPSLFKLKNINISCTLAIFNVILTILGPRLWTYFTNAQSLLEILFSNTAFVDYCSRSGGLSWCGLLMTTLEFQDVNQKAAVHVFLLKYLSQCVTQSKEANEVMLECILKMNGKWDLLLDSCSSCSQLSAFVLKVLQPESSFQDVSVNEKLKKVHSTFVLYLKASTDTHSWEVAQDLISRSVDCHWLCQPLLKEYIDVVCKESATSTELSFKGSFEGCLRILLLRQFDAANRNSSTVFIHKDDVVTLLLADKKISCYSLICDVFFTSFICCSEISNPIADTHQNDFLEFVPVLTKVRESTRTNIFVLVTQLFEFLECDQFQQWSLYRYIQWPVLALVFEWLLLRSAELSSSSAHNEKGKSAVCNLIKALGFLCLRHIPDTSGSMARNTIQCNISKCIALLLPGNDLTDSLSLVVSIALKYTNHSLLSTIDCTWSDKLIVAIEKTCLNNTCPDIVDPESVAVFHIVHEALRNKSLIPERLWQNQSKVKSKLVSVCTDSVASVATKVEETNSIKVDATSQSKSATVTTESLGAEIDMPNTDQYQISSQSAVSYTTIVLSSSDSDSDSEVPFENDRSRINMSKKQSMPKTVKLPSDDEKEDEVQEVSNGFEIASDAASSSKFAARQAAARVVPAPKGSAAEIAKRAVNKSQITRRDKSPVPSARSDSPTTSVAPTILNTIDLLLDNDSKSLELASKTRTTTEKLPMRFNNVDDYVSSFQKCLVMECVEQMYEGWRRELPKSKRLSLLVDGVKLTKNSLSLLLRGNTDGESLDRCILYVEKNTSSAMDTVRSPHGNEFAFGFVLENKSANHKQRQINVCTSLPLETKHPRRKFLKSLAAGAHVSVRVVTSLVSTIRQIDALHQSSHYPLMPFMLPLPTAGIDTGMVVPRLVEPSCWKESLRFLKDSLNSSQTAALKTIVDERNPIVLVQGPPGTGKSRTLVSLVWAMFREDSSSKLTQQPPRKFSRLREVSMGAHSSSASSNNGKRVLVCAPSNAATDELVRRMSDGIKISQNAPVVHARILRTGNLKHVHESTRKHTLEKLIDAEFEKNNKKIRVLKQSLDLLKPDLRSKEEQIGNIEKRIAELSAFSTVPGSGNLTSAVRELELKRNSLEFQTKKVRNQVKSKIFEIDTLRRKQRDGERDVQSKIIARSQVFCTTLNSSGIELLRDVNFDCIILDEAAQSIEPDLLIALRHFCCKLVMFGDHKQLPATILSPSAEQAGLGRSFFERANLCKDEGFYPAKFCMLTTQYRMHDVICRFPNATFYDGKLLTSETVSARKQQPEWLKDQLLSKRYILFNCIRGTESVGRGDSKFNPFEVELTVALISRIHSYYRSFDWFKTAAVVTPYSSQKWKLRDAIRKKFQESSNDIEIDTVDGFQGQEKDIIIFSCVRSGHDVGFLRERKRLNVALTRARHGLFIIGNVPTLKRESLWRSLVEDASSRHRVVAAERIYEYGKKNLVEKLHSSAVDRSRGSSADRYQRSRDASSSKQYPQTKRSRLASMMDLKPLGRTRK